MVGISEGILNEDEILPNLILEWACRQYTEAAAAACHENTGNWGIKIYIYVSQGDGMRED